MKTLTLIQAAGCAILLSIVNAQADIIVDTAPESQTVVAGVSVTFSVAAHDEDLGDLSYQWYRRGSPDEQVYGATEATLTLDNVQPGDGGYYYAQLDNGFVGTETPEATLIVCTQPVITTPPADQAVAVGALATLFGDGTGEGLDYAWTIGSSTNNVGGYSGDPKLCLIDTSTPGVYFYNLTLSNIAGSESSTAAVTIVSAPTIVTPPADKTITSRSNWTFSVLCTNLAGTYTWYFNGTNVLDSTTNTCTVSNVTTNDAGAYTVVLSNMVGSVTSSPAILTVIELPEITAQPQSVIMAVSNSTTLSVTASGPSLYYTWKLNSLNRQSGTNNSYTFSTNRAGTYGFTVVITNTVGSVVSSVATVTVIDVPKITTDLTNKFLAISNSYTFKVAGVNSLGTYTWYFSTNSPATVSTTNATVLNSNTNSYLLSNGQYTNAGSYWVVLSNSVGAVTSKVSSLSMLLFPSFTTNLFCTEGIVSGNTNTVPKGSLVSLNATAAGDSLSYYWLRDGTFLISTNATNILTFPATNASSPIKLTLAISNVLGIVTSTNLNLVIIGPPVISARVGVTNLVVGQNLKLTVTAAGTIPFTNLVYQWVENATNILSDATNATLSITNVGMSDAGLYSVVITNYGGSITSSAFNIAVKLDTNAPNITITAPGKTLTNLNYTVKGTARDNVSVTNVDYSLNGSNLITARNLTNSWAQWSADLTLVPGSNTVLAVATDYNGNTNKTTNVLFCAPFYPAALIASDATLGTIGGNTNAVQWGSTYTVTAKPNSRILFTGWSGLTGLTTTNSTNSLIMKFKVTTNVVGVANFATNNFYDAAGTYNGLFYDTNGIDFATAGSIKVSITTNLAYSGSMILAGKIIKLSGQVALDGSATATLQTNATLSFAMDSQQLTGTVSTVIGAVTNSAALVADLACFSKFNPATNFSGSYTMVIPPAQSGPATNGFGYANVTVSTNGDISLIGKAGDGTAISQSVPVAKDGSWPLFVPLFKSTSKATNNIITTNYNGEIIGWVTFTTNGFSMKIGPAGSISWIKTAYTNSGLYASGFTNDVDLLSSPYKAPTVKAPKVLANLVWGSIWFTGGNLTTDVGNWMFMSKSGTAFADDSSTTISFSLTGLISGKFSPDGSAKTIAYSGIVLQKTTNAFGLFLRTNSVGSVQIDAIPMGALTKP